MLVTWLAAVALGAPADDAIRVALEHLSLPLDTEATPARWRGGAHVRVRQRLRGLPVDGHHLVVSLGTDGEVRKTFGAALPSPPGSAEPTLSSRDAVRRGAAVGARLGEGTLWRPHAELVWLELRGEVALAWRVAVSTARPAAVWWTWIDAHDGTVLRTDLRSRSAVGAVYPTNPVLSSPTEVPLSGLVDGAETLEGVYTHTASCEDWTITDGLFGVTACHALAEHAVADEGGDFVFPPQPESIDDPFAEVHVYHHVDRVSRFVDETHGFALERSIQSIVNFEMANAFYGDFDGDGLPDLSFGHDPDSGVDLAYDADVAYHEFGHGVVDGLAELPFMGADDYGMEWVAGGINEGFADVLAMALTGDPRVGEYAGSAFGREAIRDLSEPRRCPDDLKGEVHADGEVLGSLAWAMMQDDRIGPEQGLDLFMGALPAWGPDITWPAVGTSLLDAAAALLDAGVLDAAGVDAVSEQLEAANILDCGRAIPLDDGREVELYLLNGGLAGDLERIPAGVQLTLEVPQNASHALVEVHDVAGDEGVGWALYARAGSHVVHEVTRIDALGLAVSVPDPGSLVAEGTGPTVVELRPDGVVPLEPGQTWYLTLASRNVGLDFFDFQYARVTVSGQWVPSEPPVVEEPRGGCGCAVPTPMPAWLGLWLAVWAAVRRRGAKAGGDMGLSVADAPRVR